MKDKELTWDEFEKTLKLTPEEEQEIRFEEELIEMEIKAREKARLSQRDLSEKTGIKQSAIARIEKRRCSPSASTLIRLLVPMGYTLRIVPINEKKNEK